MRARLLPTVATTLAVLAMPAAGHAKPVFGEPDEGPDPRGLTLNAGGLARVESPARLNEQRIDRAVAAARSVAQRRGLHGVRRRARALARAAGLNLGAMQAVTDRVVDSERFPDPSGYCRTRGREQRLRCRVPAFATASMRVTFATAETSAVVPTGRAIIASARTGAGVRPRHRTSPSVRAALGRAQLVADPLALAGARRCAADAAEAAGLGLGSLFALAEEPRQAFFPDLLTGIFGPGRFCRPRRARGPRCYVPLATSVLRVTIAVAD